MHGQERRALVAEVSTRVSYVHTIARYTYSRHELRLVYACTVPTYYIMHVSVGTVHAYTIPTDTHIPEVWLIDLSLSLLPTSATCLPPHTYTMPIPSYLRITYGHSDRHISSYYSAVTW